MEDPRIDRLINFIKANKMNSYSTLCFAGLFFLMYILSLILLNFIQGYYIIFTMCLGYILYFSTKIYFSGKIFKVSYDLNKFLNLKDIEQYGKFQLFSNLVISIIVIFSLTQILLVDLTNYETGMMLGSAFDQLKRYFSPFSSEFNDFIANSLNIFLYVGSSLLNNFIVFCIILGFFIASLLMKILCYVYLGRIYSRFVIKENQILIRKSFKTIHNFILVFLLSFGIFLLSFILEVRSLINSDYTFSNLFGMFVIFSIIIYKIIRVSKMIEKLDLNFYLDSAITPKLFKLDKHVDLNKNAIFFNPIFKKNHIKESKGLSPVIGIIICSIGGFFTIGFSSSILNYVTTWSMWDPAEVQYYFEQSLFLFIISSFVLSIGLILPLRYFRIERTKNEMIFQMGYKSDHIQLDRIEQVVLNYEIKVAKADIYHNIANISSSAKVRISIVLIIPDHQINISKTVTVVYLTKDPKSFLNQLVKVLTKTLFILGYTPNK